jgi:hypothetical protein
MIDRPDRAGQQHAAHRRAHPDRGSSSSSPCCSCSGHPRGTADGTIPLSAPSFVCIISPASPPTSQPRRARLRHHRRRTLVAGRRIVQALEVRRSTASHDGVFDTIRRGARVEPIFPRDHRLRYIRSSRSNGSTAPVHADGAAVATRSSDRCCSVTRSRCSRPASSGTSTAGRIRS